MAVNQSGPDFYKHSFRFPGSRYHLGYRVVAISSSTMRGRSTGTVRRCQQICPAEDSILGLTPPSGAFSLRYSRLVTVIVTSHPAASAVFFAQIPHEGYIYAESS